MKRTEEYTINITKRDIARGRANVKKGLFRAVSCPTFLAARRVIPGLIAVRASSIDCVHMKISSPDRLVNWIYRADTRKRVRPAKFTITV